MEKTLLLLIFTFSSALGLLAQTNPVAKSLGVYIKGFERQTKPDTLFVWYVNPVLHNYHTSKIGTVEIIEVNGYQPNQTVVKLELEEFGNIKSVKIMENSTKTNEKTKDLDIFTSSVIYVKFRVTKGRWKYKSQKIIAI